MASVPDPDTIVAEVRRSNGGYVILNLDPSDTLTVNAMIAASSVFFAQSDDVKAKAKGTSKFGYKVRMISAPHVLHQYRAWPITSIIRSCHTFACTQHGCVN